MDDSDLVWEYSGRPLQKTYWSQRVEIRRILVQGLVINGHFNTPPYALSVGIVLVIGNIQTSVSS